MTSWKLTEHKIHGSVGPSLHGHYSHRVSFVKFRPFYRHRLPCSDKVVSTSIEENLFYAMFLELVWFAGQRYTRQQGA